MYFYLTNSCTQFSNCYFQSGRTNQCISEHCTDSINQCYPNGLISLFFRSIANDALYLRNKVMAGRTGQYCFGQQVLYFWRQRQYNDIVVTKRLLRMNHFPQNISAINICDGNLLCI